MRRKLRIAGLVLGMSTIITAAPAAAAPTDSDVRGPRCADIVDGAGFYDGTTVFFRITLAASGCRQVTYNLYVLDEAGSTTVLASSAQRGDGTSTQLFYAVPVTDDDSTVCVYATTTIGRKVFDRAPDDGCADLTINGSPPGRGFR